MDRAPPNDERRGGRGWRDERGSYVKAHLPAGIAGGWIVEAFSVPPARAESDLRPEWAQTPAGQYTRLRRGRVVFMTDTREEWWTQIEAVRQATRRGGEVLVTGLGLGVVVESMLRAPGSRVERVTVVEISADVIRLVGPTLSDRYGDRLRIEQADAFSWLPPSRVQFTVGWHDIWPNPLERGIHQEMDALELRFASVCDWQGSWGRRLSQGAAQSAGGGS